MSEHLDDSPTALKIRDRVMSELKHGECILFATDGEVYSLLPDTVYIGAVVVTTTRLLVFESKALGRVVVHSIGWADVQEAGWHNDGAGMSIAVTPHREAFVASRQRRGEQLPGRWKVRIWQGRSWKSPLDKTRLDSLLLSIRDAREACAQERASASVDHAREIDDTREELRGSQGL